MKKFLPTSFLLLLFFLGIFSWFSRTDRPHYTAHLAMQSDAMTIVNYYMPKRIELYDGPLEDDLKLPVFKSDQPKFGGLIIGNSSDSLITVVVDEGKGFSDLYIDKNNNEDLTDDGEPEWTAEKNEYWAREELVDVHYKDEGQVAAVPYPIRFYRYKNRMLDAVVAFRDGYREGWIALENSTRLKIALLDDNLDGLFNDLDQTALVVDLDGDGILNGETDSPERFSLGEAFRVGTAGYRVESVSPQGDRITFVPADTLGQTRVTIEPGLPAPQFRALTIDERVVDLALLRNKVVLIDFWATWCQPWQDELPFLKRSYQRYGAQGFEIIGVNLDHDIRTVREFLTANNVTWSQLSNGEGWDMSLVENYGVEAIPKSFLIDRDGIIRYKDLHGASLGLKVYELLNESPGDGN